MAVASNVRSAAISPGRQVLTRLWRSGSFMVGFSTLVVLVALSLAAPALTPYNPIKINTRERLQPPGLNHPFGTDQMGRDILSRVLHGGRLSLPMGVVPVAIAAVVGMMLGVIAGFYGRWVDLVIMRVADVWIAFPPILMALAVVTILGTGLTNIMIALGIAWIPYYTRMARGTVISAKERVYVEAARALGSQDGRIMLKHIFPNVLTPILVMATMGVANAILAGAALNFLGLGAQAPAPEWGTMLADGRQFIRLGWWIGLFPGVTIAVTVLAANLAGDGLRDALDPKLKV
ncbi:MAG: ABC transporter permease [Trueperaceae bacterium]|nr:MAG: ABC transporter permease [Trueperaceae bacterium]